MAKFTEEANGTIDRDQSLHDNLLGNITEAALQQHFAGNTAILDALTTAIDKVDPDLLNRPYASGDEGAAGNAQAHAFDVADGFANQAHGTLVASDPIPNAALTWSISGPSTFGTMAINATTGAWTYTLDDTLSQTQALAQGEHVTQTFTATVTDAWGNTDTTNVTITIDGSNDEPVIGASSITSAVVAESSDLPGFDQAGPNGAFQLAPSLAAQVAGNSAVTTEMNGLATNPSDVHNTLLTIESQLHVNEATAIAIVWNELNTAYVTAGANQPNINQAFVYLGVEYATYLKNGGTPLTDVTAKYAADANNDGIPDRDQSLHDNLLGNISVGRIAAALRQRSDPDPDPDRADITAVDGDLLNRPYASGNEGDPGNAAAHAFDVTAGYAAAPASTLQATGTLVATDPDHGATHTWSIVNDSSTSYGTMAINATTGAWTYTLDTTLAATQALAQGETATQTFTATVTDDHGATDTINVTVTIDGTNDAPVISASSVVAANVTESGAVYGADQASLDNAFHILPALALQVSGSVTVNSELATLASNPSDVHHMLGTIESQLGVTEATAIAVVWDNLNTAYVAAGANQAGLNEAFVYLGVEYAAYLKAGGEPLVDVAAKLTVEANGTIDRDQSLHDNLLGNITEAALQQHFAGDTVVLAALTTAIDSVDANLLNRPYASGNAGDPGNAQAHAFDVANGYVTTATGTLVATDPDHGATRTWSIVNDSSTVYGTMAINAATGQWTYQLDNSLASTQALAQGDTVTQTFTATVTDDHGATDSTIVTVTVHGTNDAATFAGVDVGSVTEAGTTPGIPTTGGTLVVSDVDSPAAVLPENNVQTTYGHFSIDANGVWSYALDNTIAAVNALTPSSTPLQDVITVSTADGTTHDIDVAIHGAADAPVVNAVSATVNDTAAQDAGTVVLHGNLLTDGGIDTTPDAGVTLSVTAFAGQAVTGPGLDLTTAYGTMHVNTDGSYTFTGNAGLDGLDAGQQASLFESFTVASSDGASANSNISLILNGAADTPVITSGTTGTEAEHTATSNVVYQITATDRDNPSNLTYSLTGTDAADFTISSTGAVTFNNSPNYESQNVFHITVNEFENGTAEASQNVTINVTPVDDSLASISITDQTPAHPAPVVGDVLQANLGPDADGGITNPIQFQWFDKGNVVSTGATYTVAAGDIGDTITVQAIYTDGKGFQDTVLSGPTGVVVSANHPPMFTGGAGSGEVQGQVGIAAQNFLVNGGFETGSTGWTATVLNGNGSVHFGLNFVQAGGQNFYASSFGNGAIQADLSQAVQTVAGVSYALTFYAETAGTNSAGDLVVTWNGAVVDTITQSQLTDTAYHQFTVQVTGTGGLDALQFAVNDPNGSPLGDTWRIDTVSLTPAQHYESTSGSIAFTDADATDTHTVAVTHTGNNYIGQLAASVNDATHQVNWTFYASDSDLAAMTSAEETQTYTLTLNDGHGGTSTDTVTITLDRPVDSPPVITSGAATGSVTQDGSLGVINLIQDSVFNLPDPGHPQITPWFTGGNGGFTAGSGTGGRRRDQLLQLQPAIDAEPAHPHQHRAGLYRRLLRGDVRHALYRQCDRRRSAHVHGCRLPLARVHLHLHGDRDHDGDHVRDHGRQRRRRERRDGSDRHAPHRVGNRIDFGQLHLHRCRSPGYPHRGSRRPPELRLVGRIGDQSYFCVDQRQFA